MDDDTKRAFFVKMFHLPGVTETTLDLAMESTDTFEELCFAIRSKMANKEHMEKNENNVHVNQTSISEDRQRSI